MKIGSYCVCRTKNDLIFFADSLNMIFILNLENYKIKFMHGIPEEEFTSSFLISDIIYTGQSFVFIPGNAKKIWICNENFNNWESINLEYAEKNQKFHNAVLCKDDIYLLQHNYPYSIKYNIESGEIYKFELCNNAIITDSCVINNNIYCAVANKPFIIKYNICNGKIKKINTYEENGFNAICKSGDIAILAPRKGENICFVNDDFVKKIKIPTFVSRGIFRYKDAVFITSCEKYESIKVLSEKKYEYNFLGEENPNNCSYLITQILATGELIIMDSKSNLKIWNNKGEKIYENEIVLCTNELKKIQSDLNNFYIKENYNFTLRDFIQII